MRLGCFRFHALLLLWCATVEPACGGGGPHEHNHFLGSGLHSRSGAAGSGPCTLSLPAALVNDDFCDCADGSDEPRTSACAHVDWHDAVRVPTPTRFACANDGHIPTQLAASRVQDGVCDCCDGTDEVPGRCAETCFEVGRAWREVREATERAIRSGLAKRNESLARLEASVAAARKDVAERRAELRRVEALTAGLRAHLALEEVCEYAEQLAAKNDCGVGPGGTATPASGGARAAGRQCVPQPLSRVRDLAARSRALAGVNDSSPHAHAVLSSRYDLPAGGDHGVGKEASGGELPAFVVARAFTEATVPSASDVRCNYRSHEHLHWSSLLARVLGVALVPTRLLWELVRLPFWLLTASPTPAPTPTPLPAGVDGAAVVGAPPTTAVSSLGILSLTAAGAKAAEGFVGTAWALSTLAWVPGMLSPRLDKRHRRTEATMLRQFIGTAEGEGTALRRAVKRLEELALLDTSSPDALLFLLGDECFQLVDNEYTYKVCPFQHVQQNGVSLGSWTEDANPNPFVPGADVRADRYSARAPSAYTMNFTKGRACHNGVTRAARVHFYCGDDNRVDTVQETELCKYEIDFFSPFVCSELSLSSSVL